MPNEQPRRHSRRQVLRLSAAGTVGLTAGLPLARGDEAEFEPIEASKGLTRADLRRNRIRLEQPESGWQVTRLAIRPDLYDGYWEENEDSEVTVDFVLESEEGSADATHVAIGWLLEHHDEDDPFDNTHTLSSLTIDESVSPLSIRYRYSCSETACDAEPPRSQFAFVVGTSGGDTTLSLGLADGEDADSTITDRDVLTWENEHEGETMRGGTHAELGTDPGAHWTAGDIDVVGVDEGSLPGETSGRTHLMGMDASIPSGTTNATFYGLDAAESISYTGEYALPTTAGSGSGTYNREERVGLYPVMAVQLETDAGEAAMRLDRTVAGQGEQPVADDEHQVYGTWTSFDATLEELYGWSLWEWEVPPGAGASTPAVPTGGPVGADAAVSLSSAPSADDNLPLTPLAPPRRSW